MHTLFDGQNISASPIPFIVSQINQVTETITLFVFNGSLCPFHILWIGDHCSSYTPELSVNATL